MQLYRVIFPEKAEQNHELYFRADGPVALRGGALALQAGTVIRFDTYFNGFFYTKYLNHTQTERLTVKIRTSGRLEARLVCAAPDQPETVLETMELSSADVTAEFQPVPLRRLPKGGVVYCVFAAREAGVITEISYEAEIRRPNRVRIAGVICTYRREEYVQRNLRRIDLRIWKDNVSPAARDIDILVIDNGKSLAWESSEHVTILPNKNCGGSGGFARGMIEALHCKDRYTHVLLMDDDISFEPMVLERTVQLLKAARTQPNPLCVGGQMLLESEPAVQFESGSRYENGRLWPVNQGMDVSSLENLLQNEREYPVDYNAWWYCCIPLALIRKRGLPLPFFIKTDDVEYGLRSGAEFLLMNGIGVWHKAFLEKQSAHLEYYTKRNELIVSALYRRGDGVLSSIHKLFCSLGGSILRGRTDCIRYIRWGYRDFLKGPAFLLETDTEATNRLLLEGKTKKAPSTVAAFFWSGFICFAMLFRFLFSYQAVQRDFIDRMDELTGEAFWIKQLGLRESGE